MSDQPPLVLVVDDFEDNREMYAEYLAFAGLRADVATNGQEALDKALACIPDIIIMDLSLPGMDGWEATRRLKGDPRTRHIPVVALSGHALAGHSQRARDAGCDAFLAKPCLPDALVAEVRRMLAVAPARPAVAKNRVSPEKIEKGKTAGKGEKTAGARRRKPPRETGR